MKMETKMTTKTIKLKELLVKAWKERWTDLQWGIHIKTILPRGVSGDVYNLADCILQQALVGPGPNQLVLSYLKHALSSQLVSYAAVLQRISKYDVFHKPHCILSLLEFLETIHIGITCRGKSEEDLLAASVLSITHWLLQCYFQALTTTQTQNSHNNNNNNNSPLAPQAMELMDKPASILKDMLHSDFMCAMLYLAKHDDKELYASMVKKCQDIELLLKTKQSKSSLSIQESMKKVCNLEMESLCPSLWKAEMEPITYCLQPLLAVDVMLNPCTETWVFVSQLLVIQRFKSYSNARFYCEIIRAVLTCLRYARGTPEESQWAAFAFLKMHLLLKELVSVHAQDNMSSSSSSSSSSTSSRCEEFSQDVCDAFELLLQFSCLLDIIDASCSGNCYEFLLMKLQEINLVSEKHAKQLISKREPIAPSALAKLDSSNIWDGSIITVISRAEPTLDGILKTLNTGCTTIQDPLLSMLYQVLNGKSFELMLAVATVTGKLKTFVSRLIKFNEYTKVINDSAATNVTGKNAAMRSLLFDISFVMLCSIVQNYGSDVVLEEGGDSFFEQWVRDCMPERGKPKSPQKMLQGVDGAKVDQLLSQINSSSGGTMDLKQLTSVKWSVMCQSAMGVVKELLCAWESGVLSASDVKRALEGLQAVASCLPICAAAWLCAHMSVSRQDALLKPINMVHIFATSSSSASSCYFSSTDDLLKDNYKEQLNLMQQIIRKMQYDVHPPTQSKTKVLELSHSIVSRQPILEQLESTWQSIHQCGWVDNRAMQYLECLLNTGGSLWFVSHLVREVIKFKYQQDLDRAVDMAFAIFHLDIEHCTLHLLNSILPQYLFNSLQCDELMEPQSCALAKLCVYCIFSSLEHLNVKAIQQQQKQQGGNGSSGRKRPWRSDSQGAAVNQLEGAGSAAVQLGAAVSAPPANKILRLNEAGDASAIFASNANNTNNNTNSNNTAGSNNTSAGGNGGNSGGNSNNNPGNANNSGNNNGPNVHAVVNNGQEGNGAGSSPILREPLYSAIDKLFDNFTYLTSKNGGQVSQKTHLILNFLQLVVLCGKERTRLVLQNMPQDLVPSLIKALPECFSTDLLLNLYDIQTSNGRRATARDLCLLRNINLKPPPLK